LLPKFWAFVRGVDEALPERIGRELFHVPGRSDPDPPGVLVEDWRRHRRIVDKEAS
jgi:hypothetical protein